MEITQLTNLEARKFILSKHGLVGKHKFTDSNGVINYIRQAGCIQFDPIDICGKNAELVLQSRIKNFNKEMLFDLLYKDRKLVDYFDKNLSIFSIEDWKYFRRMRDAHSNNGRNKDQVDKVSAFVKQFIKVNKFACSKDIKLSGSVSWYWSASSLSRVALEAMYFRGELAIHHKKGAIKYYSLIEDTFTQEIINAPEPNITDYEYKKWLVLRRIGSVGLLWNKPSDAWLGIGGWMWPSLKASERNTIFKDLLYEGKIIQLKVENIPDELCCLSTDKKLLNEVIESKNYEPRCEFIAPLDNMLWDRKLIKAIFNFDYKWEIYTPASERKYGYYVLPVLYGTDLIGRIEVVANKKERILTVKNIWYENDFSTIHGCQNQKETSINGKKFDNDNFHTLFNDCLKRFAAFNGCGTYKLNNNLLEQAKS